MRSAQAALYRRALAGRTDTDPRIPPTSSACPVSSATRWFSPSPHGRQSISSHLGWRSCGRDQICEVERMPRVRTQSPQPRSRVQGAPYLSESHAQCPIFQHRVQRSTRWQIVTHFEPVCASGQLKTQSAQPIRRVQGPPFASGVRTARSSPTPAARVRDRGFSRWGE